MSKSLIKLIDLSLLPAILMAIAKFAGVVIVIRIFDLPWAVKEYANSLFSVSTVLRTEDLSVVTSYSDLIMYSALAFGLSVMIFRATYFHNSHIKPKLLVRLSNINLLSLVQSSYEIYHSAFIWVVFCWISNLLILINVANQKTFVWVGILATISSVTLTGLLIRDVYKEIESIKKSPSKYNWQ